MRKVTLIGNPNSGKTSLFNLLTGSNQKVGNWPGVTVDRKSGLLKLDKAIEIQDLPGVYSLSPYTSEEKVARDYLLSGQSQVIIDVLDASNLERNLYLTTQLLELGVPCLLALNMIDVVEKNGHQINSNKLSYQLGVPVVSISALKNKGIDSFIKQIQKIVTNGSPSPYPIYDDRLEAALSQINQLLSDYDLGVSRRHYLIKLFERDPLVQAHLNLPSTIVKEIESISAITEKIFMEDAESIVINQRYAYIDTVCQMAQIKKDNFELKLSDKIDNLITNRFLALPIFAVIMFIVYYLSIQTIGTLGTDWVNDYLFGKLVPDSMQTFLTYLKVEYWLKSLIIDGVIAGIGAVLGFVPQLFVLFFCLGILEDIGYMSRIAFVMDRIFRKFGLSGKTFIPMLIATGCGVPAIMASRTIENEQDRKITIMTSTFMPCSAKMSIVALISGVFFPNNPLIAPSAYFIGIVSIILSGIALKKTKLLSSQASPFIMELPSYHLPHFPTVVLYAYNKALSFVKRAGTVIFVLTIALWYLTSYNFHFQAVNAQDSILAILGQQFAWIFSPLGFGNWKATVATFSGLLAKETVVATFGIFYQNNQISDASNSGLLWHQLRLDYPPLAAYSFLVFNLLCAPCFAAIGAIKREMNSRKWSLFAILFQTVLAYLMSFLIYQLGLVIQTGKVSLLTVIAVFLVGLVSYLVLRKPKESHSDLITLTNIINFGEE
ncbi:ferrous iron transport protein B [Streptococcus hongkongensis]|nr:ferrous iron transporter B [Streptococcus uberis]